MTNLSKYKELLDGALCHYSASNAFPNWLDALLSYSLGRQVRATDATPVQWRHSGLVHWGPKENQRVARDRLSKLSACEKMLVGVSQELECPSALLKGGYTRDFYRDQNRPQMDIDILIADDVFSEYANRLVFAHNCHWQAQDVDWPANYELMLMSSDAVPIELHLALSNKIANDDAIVFALLGAQDKKDIHTAHVCHFLVHLWNHGGVLKPYQLMDILPLTVHPLFDLKAINAMMCSTHINASLSYLYYLLCEINAPELLLEKWRPENTKARDKKSQAFVKILRSRSINYWHKRSRMLKALVLLYS